MSKENIKKGKFTPEEIANLDGEKMSELRQKQHDHYAGKLRTTYDSNRGVPIITNVREDPWKGHKSKKQHESSNVGGGEPLNNEVNFDKKAYQDFHD